MDGLGFLITHITRPTTVPGTNFGESPLPARRLDPGMGVAVARRTVFRPGDQECFGRVADRVAAGNMALLGRPLDTAELQERARLRNAIATGALLTSGRHLQHAHRVQEWHFGPGGPGLCRGGRGQLVRWQ